MRSSVITRDILLMIAGITLALNAGSIRNMLNPFSPFLAASLLNVSTVVLGWFGVPLPSLGGIFPCIPGVIVFVLFRLLAPEDRLITFFLVDQSAFPSPICKK